MSHLAKSQTLWEKWTTREPVVEFYNPISVGMSSVLKIDDIGIRDENFLIKEINQYTRLIGSKQFKFTDYVLNDKLKLRVNPSDSEAQNDIILLRLTDEFKYDKGFMGVVNDPSLIFRITDEAKGQNDEYFRINDMAQSYHATVYSLKEKVDLTKILKSNLEEYSVEYWDYWRETKDEANQTILQFVFIEREFVGEDRDNGWFQIWHGEKVNPKRVITFA